MIKFSLLDMAKMTGGATIVDKDKAVTLDEAPYYFINTGRQYEPFISLNTLRHELFMLISRNNSAEERAIIGHLVYTFGLEYELEKNMEECWRDPPTS